MDRIRIILHKNEHYADIMYVNDFRQTALYNDMFFRNVFDHVLIKVLGKLNDKDEALIVVEPGNNLEEIEALIINPSGQTKIIHYPCQIPFI